ncbi:hypothetical protein FDUTEX481_07297 [Tolypothrix sp. PCC 7601]|nr:hypothetical protein FDUTEX481_07297 [Tolypothrix sp. PCC 7601]BAY88185.1 hypothetical protein NIES3275_01600 [Microchaete diplosiphon NIES-3275]
MLMKSKLLRMLTVFLLSLVVLSPALVAIIIVWQEHLNFQATQNLVYAVSDVQQFTNHGVTMAISILLWLIILAPIGLCLGITLHKGYVAYRAAVLQRKIQMLEKMWQQNTYPEEIIL